MSQSTSTELRRVVTNTPVTNTPITPGAAQRSDEWAQLLFAAQQRNWLSLAIVPAGAGGASAQYVANALADVARLYHQGNVHLFNGVGAAPGAAAEIVAEMRMASSRRELSMVAVDFPMTNAAAIHIARAADAAILLVPLGVAHIQGARHVIDAIGRERVLGCLTVQVGKRSKRNARS